MKITSTTHLLKQNMQLAYLNQNLNLKLPLSNPLMKHPICLLQNNIWLGLQLNVGNLVMNLASREKTLTLMFLGECDQLHG